MHILSMTLLMGCTRVSKPTAATDSGKSAVDSHAPQPDPIDTGTAPPVDSGPAEDEVDLVAATAWQPTHTSDDPVPSHQPDPIECEADSVRVENGLLEIQTNDCNYALIGQPLLHDIQVGDTIDLLVYHSSLSANEPAEGHVLVSIGGMVVWEKTVPIPSTSEVYPFTTTATQAIPAGTQAIVHLHNHGGNSWKLAHLRRQR